ncbi:hypothetical protein PF008_g23951 [Phytophthora fragariae]|uniref:Uncharacterized protein n=1 Tax=Phytophthora fragariae TaxID=53985 RepID=A0A6G0QPA8_9STRA|nr:hypothetical protein PF008_g23951 [Phytophthora fragariae]
MLFWWGAKVFVLREISLGGFFCLASPQLTSGFSFSSCVCGGTCLQTKFVGMGTCILYSFNMNPGALLFFWGITTATNNS